MKIAIFGRIAPHHKYTLTSKAKACEFRVSLHLQEQNFHQVAPIELKKMVPCKGCFPIWKSPFSVASPPAFFTPATGTLARRAESAENADSARRCRIAKLARRAESTENADSARRRWIAMSNPAARIYFEFWTFKIENAQEEKILGNQSFSSWKSGGPG